MRLYMRIGLFVPCYVNQFYPQVGIATLRLLERFGCDVVYPLKQTCCGQPMANSGYAYLSKGCDELFVKNFKGLDYVVSPSGSCVLHLKEHLHDEQRGEDATHIRNTIYEFTEFVTDVLKIKSIKASFPYKVGIHQSCHGQRGLKLAQMSELVESPYSKPESLLKMVDGLQLIELKRTDECCGFGGTFCVMEEAVSAKMGKDRVQDHLLNGAEVITGADMSCLMHMEGILRRQNSKVVVKHISEILISE
jgi:L-lactate dehydrogenase complex protein LldE